MVPIIIIGSGLAGYGLARQFRLLDKTTPLLIITADDGRAYSKPMLSNALAQGKTAETLVSADAVTMAEQLNAEIRTRTRVASIDSVAHEIVINNERIRYSKLVLALGADSIRLSLAGDGADDVFSVNDLADYGRFRAAIEGKKKIALLGGGLIGCEFANDLADAGFQVDIIERSPWPLGRLLPETVGRSLQQGLVSLGVGWHGNDSVRTVERSADGYTLALDSGARFEAEVVLCAIGLQPRVVLAAEAGLAIERGIKVDAYLHSSAADIYALGDCAEVEGLLLPFIAPLLHASRALAQTLAGKVMPVSYPAMPVMLKTPAYPVSVLPPPPGVAGHWQVSTETGSVRALYHDDKEGCLRGFALGGSVAKEGHQLARQIPPLLSLSV